MGWFEDFKENLKKFNNLDNALELYKFKSEKETNLIQWIFGIGILLLLSVNIQSISQLKFFAIFGIIAFVVAYVLILIGIILVFVLTNRHKKAINYLCLEKDKRDKK